MCARVRATLRLSLRLRLRLRARVGLRHRARLTNAYLSIKSNQSISMCVSRSIWPTADS